MSEPEKTSQESITNHQDAFSAAARAAARKEARKETSARALRENLKKRKRRLSEKTTDGDSL